MRKDKKLIEKECECGLKIKGTSEKHAEMNLMIHQRTSQKHKKLLELKKKWLKEKL